MFRAADVPAPVAVAAEFDLAAEARKVGRLVQDREPEHWDAVDLQEVVLHQDAVVAQLVVVVEQAAVAFSRFDRGIIGGDRKVIVIVLDVFAGRESCLVNLQRSVEEAFCLFADAVEQAGFQREVRELDHAGQEVAGHALGTDYRGFRHDFHFGELFTEVVHDITEQCHAGSRVFQHSLVVFHGHGLHDARQDAEFDVPGGFKIIKLGVEIDYDLIGGHLGSGGLDYSISACYQIVPDKFVGIRGRIETIR